MGWGGMWFDSNSMLGALRDPGEKGAPKDHTGPCPFISLSASLFPDCHLASSTSHFLPSFLFFGPFLSVLVSPSTSPGTAPTTRGLGQEWGGRAGARRRGRGQSPGGDPGEQGRFPPRVASLDLPLRHREASTCRASEGRGRGRGRGGAPGGGGGSRSALLACGCCSPSRCWGSGAARRWSGGGTGRWSGGRGVARREIARALKDVRDSRPETRRGRPGAAGGSEFSCARAERAQGSPHGRDSRP